MPRARTQLGSASWADTLSELAVVIQAMPPMNIAGTATWTFGAMAITPVAAACSRGPQKQRRRDRPRAHRRQQQREGAGAAALQPPGQQRQQRQQRGGVQKED